MDLIVDCDGTARWNGLLWRCALGRSGVRRDKREGDGATPVGDWPLRRLLYRPDRFAMAPQTLLPAVALEPDDGWCDDPANRLYNQPVKLPFHARTESLWRGDRLYDLIVPLGYNDTPIVPGLGSAIFLHVASPDYGPTEGCVALAPTDLLTLLAEVSGDSALIVKN